MTTIKVKSKSGTVNELQVEEILEIDGKPYTPQGDVDQIQAIVNHLSGRVATIEQLLQRGE